MVYFQSSYLIVGKNLEDPLYDASEEGFESVLDHNDHDLESGWVFRTAPSPLSKEEIVRSIEFLNANYEILNLDKYGPVEDVRIVVVVQVHNRIEYLKILISTLKEARYIQTVLLIFSHDYSSPAINKLIKSIDFCMVMQIFYPYSIQLFPNVFPGQDPSDCPEKATKEEAAFLKCNNWENSDKYGHFRVAKFTQIKHHWWWKINYVFDGIMKQYSLTNAWVIMLEEDHYVAPDFLHVMQLIVDNKPTFCVDCQVISLGLYLKQYDHFKTDLDRLAIHPWFSSKHNMGMGINVNTWELIKNCTELFCEYDDYNWDWSLLRVSIKCLPSRLRVIAVKAPRVIHIGDCGVHTHRCAVHNAAAMATKLFHSVVHSLFPKTMVVSENLKRTLKPSKENGGWGDIRDHKLCLKNSYVPDLAAFDFDLGGVHSKIGHENISQPLIVPV
ncbi:unnamed protein product [Thelazia callipaeda]|uniref:Alpha-1,6-mannosyl-glycoprotein 2-beta-N-acetylglucosaminyltransferase n=1 Tax=Thelazia callipaeda TaxID=103827 RepID=A0A0N5CV42_THECL|nr:unnamed protein product [Thelazia callipaeda]